MRDDLPDWLEDDEDPPPRRRRTALLVLAVLPWLVVLSALVSPRLAPTPPDGDDPDADSAADAPTGVHDGHGDAPPPGSGRVDVPAGTDPGVAEGASPAQGTESAEPGWWLPEHRRNRRPGPGDGVTASVAVAVARAWLTGLPPRLEVRGITPSGDEAYVEHLAVEAIERPEAGAAVVTLLAVVLEVGEEQTADVRRLAVPLVEDAGGPRPGGSPWWLPAPDLAAVPVDGEPVDDPALLAAATAAIHGAGLGNLEVVALERTSRWPWIARVRGDVSGAPDGEADGEADGRAADGAVWLRRHLDGFALAGEPLPRTPSGAPVPDASSTPPHGDDEEVDP
jgi:hypothetical protein